AVGETCGDADEGVNQITDQPINSAEQEVIGLLMAQQHVFSNTSDDSVKAVAMVPREVLQDETVVDEVSDHASLDNKQEHQIIVGQQCEQESATASIMETVQHTTEDVSHQSTDNYVSGQSSLTQPELVQSVVVSTASGTVYLEQQAITLTELPGGVHAIPATGPFEGGAGEAFHVTTGERPFKCPYEGCGRAFTTSNIRKVHMRTHTGERPYICEAIGCGRAFASATNFKNHSRIHTDQPMQSYDTIPSVIGEFDEDGTPANKRQRVQFTEMPGHHAYAQVVPVTVSDEASVAAIQAMDGTLADMQHITEGTQITIPVAIATEAGIEVHDARGLQHALGLSENDQMPVGHALVHGNGHGMDLDSTVTVTPNTVVVTSLEGSTVVTQAGGDGYQVVHTELPSDEDGPTEVVHLHMVKEVGEGLDQEVGAQDSSDLQGGKYN
ncbi:hypothetical protein QZH41_012706, partial [Actinostola sp. cb2023]